MANVKSYMAERGRSILDSGLPARFFAPGTVGMQLLEDEFAAERQRHADNAKRAQYELDLACIMARNRAQLGLMGSGEMPPSVEIDEKDVGDVGGQ